MLNSGLGLADSLRLTADQKDQALLAGIEAEMRQGKPLSEFLPRYLPSAIAADFEAMVQVMPLAKAISLAAGLRQVQQENRRQRRQILGYPLTILTVTAVGLIVFGRVCLPALIQMMSGFKADASGLRLMQQLLGAFSFLCGALALTAMPMGFWLMRPEHQLLGYILLIRMHLAGPLRRWLGLDFSRCFCRCLKEGCPTRTTLELLQQLRHKPFIKWMSYHVEQALMQGQSLEKAFSSEYLDPSLVRFLRIAEGSGRVSELMENYVLQQQSRLQRDGKRAAQLLQISAYLLIGVIIVVIYQILLLPLAVMSEL